MSSQRDSTLRERLRAILSAEFDGVEPAEVADALTGLATELQQMSEAGVRSISELGDASSGWTGRIGGESVFPLPAEAERSTYTVSAEEDREIANLLNQTLHVGAVMLELDEPPPLNDFINVGIQFPTLHLNLETQGRVVHVSPEKVAVEVSQLGKEDRAALENLFDDYRHLLFEEGSESEAPDTEEARPPDEMPTERQPRGASRSRAGSTQTGRARPNPADSVPIPSLSKSNQGRQFFRRQVELTDPDAAVLRSTTENKRSQTREFHGPAIPWTEPSGEPARVEKLVDDRIIDILLQISQDGLTGLVEYQSEDFKRQLLFDGGFVVQISRDPRNADEELGPMLHRADRITEQQLSMAAAHADEHGRTIARSLLDLDILDPERIRHAISGRLTYLMREIAGYHDGETTIYDSQDLPAGFLPAPPLRVHVPVERVIFRRLFEKLKQVPLKERETRMSDYLETYPEIPKDELDRVTRSLSEEEHEVLVERIANGRRRLTEVFTESSLTHADTYAIIHALHRMGLLRFDRSLHHTIVRERFRENVTVKYLSVHKASYFEVLNVHWSSHTKVIEEAYEDLTGQFDPANVPEDLEDEVHQRVREIRDRIESAYQVLAERETRHAYRKRIMPEYKLTHAIPLFLKQSELAERRSQWGEAKDAVMRILEIEPDNADARRRLDRLEAILDNRLSPNAADSNF